MAMAVARYGFTLGRSSWAIASHGNGTATRGSRDPRLSPTPSPHLARTMSGARVVGQSGMRGLRVMRLPGRRRLHVRVPVAWDLGLGRELGYVFWAMIGIEAAFGAYVGIWPLWIEALGAPITVVGLVLGSAGLLRLLTLAPSAALADRIDPRKLILVGRSLTCI